MSLSQLVVAVVGLAAIVWVNWYFLFARRSTVRAASSRGVQEIEILVKGGYEPAEVHVRRGIPLRLVFDRRETAPCSEEVVIGAFGIRRFLEPFKKTVVELMPASAGVFDITCGMSMLHGTLVVED